MTSICHDDKQRPQIPRTLSFSLLLLGALAGACSGGKPATPAVPPVATGGRTGSPDAAATGGATGTGGTGVPSTDGGVGGQTGEVGVFTVDSGSASADAAPSAPAAGGPVRLMPVMGQVIGGTLSGCVQDFALGGAGRWCALSVPAADKTELWVVNTTKIGGGTAGCDRNQPDAPDCRRLSGDLATRAAASASPTFPDDMEFEGRTLLYFAEPVTTDVDEVFKGAAYVWQPGWAAAKQLSPAASFCFLTAKGEAATCLENVALEPTITGEFYAGLVADGRLKKITNLTLYKDDTVAHAIGFSDDASHVTYSGIEGNGPETLWMAPTAALTDRSKFQKVAADMHAYYLSPHLKSWFYLRKFNYDVSNPSGTLVSAPYPTIGAETMLAPNVGEYEMFEDAGGTERWMMFRQNMKAEVGTLKLLRDLGKPATEAGNVVTVADGVHAGAELSRDGRFVRFSKNHAEVAMDIYVSKPGAAEPCALAAGMTGADWDMESLHPSGKVVIWADNYDDVKDEAEGWVADPDGCKNKRKFSDNIWSWRMLGEKRVFYVEAVGNEIYTLRYVDLGADAVGSFASSTVIATGVMENSWATSPGGEMMIYTKATGDPATDGIYYHPLPPPR